MRCRSYFNEVVEPLFCPPHPVDARIAWNVAKRGEVVDLVANFCGPSVLFACAHDRAAKGSVVAFANVQLLSAEVVPRVEDDDPVVHLFLL